MILIVDANMGDVETGEVIAKPIEIGLGSAVEADLGSRAKTGIGLCGRAVPGIIQRKGVKKRIDIGMARLRVSLAFRHDEIAAQNRIEPELISLRVADLTVWDLLHARHLQLLPVMGVIVVGRTGIEPASSGIRGPGAHR